MLSFLLKRIKAGKSILLFFLLMMGVFCDFGCRYMAGILCEYIGNSRFEELLVATAGMGIILFLLKSAVRLLSQEMVADFRWNLKSEIENSQMSEGVINNYDTSSGFGINVIQYETENLARLMQRLMRKTLPDFIMMGVSLTGLFAIHTLLGGLGFICMILPVPIVVHMSKALESAYKEYYEKRDELIENEEGRLVNLELIKMLRFEQKVISEHYEKLKSLKIVNRKAAIVSAVLSTPTMIFSFMTTMVLGIAGGFLLYYEQITLGQLVTVFLVVDCLVEPVMTLDGTLTVWKKAVVSKERIANIICKKSDTSSKNVWPVEIHSISFKNIKIILPNERELVIGNHIITQKSMNVIVGVNGSGKSTLISLIMKSFDRYEGEILVNDINIRDLSYEDVAKQVSVCTQDSMLFPCSIGKNLDMDRLGENEKRRIEILLAESGLSKEIERLQQGYNTILNERGEPLSLGQQQRLQIIKTVSKDAAVYIFDESTSSFGGEERQWFFELMTKLAKEKIVIWISHEKEYPSGSDVWEIGCES